MSIIDVALLAVVGAGILGRQHHCKPPLEQLVQKTKRENEFDTRIQCEAWRHLELPRQNLPDRPNCQNPECEMNHSIKVVAPEPDVLGNADSKKLLRPLVVRDVGVNVTGARDVEQHKRNDTCECSRAEELPARNKRKSDQDGAGRDVLKVHLVRKRRTNAARHACDYEQNKEGSFEPRHVLHWNVLILSRRDHPTLGTRPPRSAALFGYEVARARDRIDVVPGDDACAVMSRTRAATGDRR